MTSVPRSSRVWIGLLFFAGLLLLLPATGSAKPIPINSQHSETWVELRSKGLKQLKRAGVKCKVFQPLEHQHHGAHEPCKSFADTDYFFGFALAQVSVSGKGDATLKHFKAASEPRIELTTKRKKRGGKRSKRRGKRVSKLILAAPVLTFDAQGKGTAKFRVGKKQIPFFSLTSPTRKGLDPERLHCQQRGVATLRLSRQGVREIKKRLGARVKRSAYFATLQYNFTPKVGPDPRCDGQELPPNTSSVSIGDGELVLEHDFSFIVGLPPTAWPQAPGDDAPAFAPFEFEVMNGECTPDQTTVRANGDIAYEDLVLSDPIWKQDSEKTTLSFEVEGQRVPVASWPTPRGDAPCTLLVSGIWGMTLHQSLPAGLTAEGAALFNSHFGTSFEAGAAYATLDGVAYLGEGSEVPGDDNGSEGPGDDGGEVPPTGTTLFVVKETASGAVLERRERTVETEIIFGMEFTSSSWWDAETVFTAPPGHTEPAKTFDFDVAEAAPKFVYWASRKGVGEMNDPYDGRIAVANLDGTEHQVLPNPCEGTNPNLDDDSPAHDGMPAGLQISHDASAVYVVCDETGPSGTSPKSTFWRINVAGGNATELAAAEVKITNLALSPDGTTFAFYGEPASGPMRIFTMPSSGGSPSALSMKWMNDASALTWSPSGQIVFMAESTGDESLHGVDWLHMWEINPTNETNGRAGSLYRSLFSSPGIAYGDEYVAYVCNNETEFQNGIICFDGPDNARDVWANEDESFSKLEFVNDAS